MFCFTFWDLLSANANERPDSPALTLREETLTYAQLQRAADQFARSLSDLGVRKGDRVCTHLRKSFEEVIAAFAISRIGGVFVNVNHQLTLRQLRHVIENSQSRILITDPLKANALANEGTPEQLQHIVISGDSGPSEPRYVLWAQLSNPSPPPFVRLIDSDLCAILYTSGSTGKPKGVMLSHRNVVQSAMASATHLENKRSDRIISVLSLSFDFGLVQLTSMFLTGGTLVLQPVQLPAEILKTIRSRSITGIAMVPTMWIPLIKLMEDNGITCPGVEYVANSGGMLPRRALRAWPTVFPNARHYLMYGMTEGFRSSYLPPEDFERKLGSIGKPLPNVELFVVDPQKGLCEPNEHGELLHRGGLISLGYWNAPEATSEKIKVCTHLRPLIGDEKVLYSGDTVYQDDEGYLWFVSRNTEFIKCSDYRISPTEVEDVIFESGLVSDVVAFGVADEALGQVVHVVVSRASEINVDVQQLLQFCKTAMPNYMVPRRIHAWPSAMPRTGNGKVDRPSVISALREQIATERHVSESHGG